MAKNNELDMLNGALLPKILMFSLPLALTGILQLLFNAADVIVVGKFAGSTSLAAVGATSALVNLLTGAFWSRAMPAAATTCASSVPSTAPSP